MNRSGAWMNLLGLVRPPRAFAFCFVILLSFLLASCSSDSTGASTVRTVDADTFATEMDRAGFVIQAHTPYVRRIEGTDLIAQRWQNLASYDLPEDKNARILVYCRSGRMSGIAARELARLGYTDVVDLDGGMISWERSGRLLVTG